MPDYKNSFPRWPVADLREHVPGIDDDGVELLHAMFVYVPTERVSAKAALSHRYLRDLDLSLPPIQSLYLPVATATAATFAAQDRARAHKMAAAAVAAGKGEP